MDTPEVAPEAATETSEVATVVEPEATPEVVPEAAKPKRVRTKKPEELSDPETAPRKTTDWSLGFTIVDN
ncbi:hypothetical protein [Shinella zoogloeoides]|uniref:hypothetical protein n=1 Tax=Shinella zoogloeoides TaxID=352475 RepID=UPI0028AAC184|nr:hypothetical protein [Shinella zoogloeoides]